MLLIIGNEDNLHHIRLFSLLYLRVKGIEHTIRGVSLSNCENPYTGMSLGIKRQANEVIVSMLLENLFHAKL